MLEIQNREGVARIFMYPKAITKCRIGQDWYKCDFEIEFTPTHTYPDYMMVDEFILKSIDGQELNIEEATKILYDFLMALNPARLRVTNRIRDCKTHFDVDVVIE